MIDKNTLIYDLETATFGKKPDGSKDKLRVFGCYSFKTNKYYCLYNEEDILNAIKNHKYLVGFNNKQYDNTVLKHNGFENIVKENKYGDCLIKGKINIDLQEIILKRAGAMKTKKGKLEDLLLRYSLDFITKLLDIVDENEGKKELDYNLLNPEVEYWTSENKKIIEEYTKRDLEVTKKLYEWLENYFECFKDFLHQKDVDNKQYLTCAISVFTYKAICKKLGVEEEYTKNPSEDFGGGYVGYPAGDYFEGYIFCLDFNSLYPHVFSQCNLFTPASRGWTGNGVFKVKGCYNDKNMGRIEQLLMEFYKMRNEFKKNKDPREYSVKIIINTSYGLTGNPTFKHLFNPIGASDCTRIGRQWTILARKMFREAGFKIIYTDTDSVYIKIKPEQKQHMLEIKNKIIKIIKDNVPFPQNTFDLGIDDEITHMWFFKGQGEKEDNLDDDFYSDNDDFLNKPLGLMKKNYIYIAKVFNEKGEWVDSKVVYKNLGVKKKSTSTITRYIFREILIPKIKEEKKVKWPKKYFEDLIKDLLKKDLYLIATRYKVNSAETYKKPSQIQAQIARAYGKGLHFLIKNKKIGIGIGNKYCTVEEFKDNNLTIDDIDLSGIWSELGYFIEKKEEKGLDNWGL